MIRSATSKEENLRGVYDFSVLLHINVVWRSNLNAGEIWAWIASVKLLDLLNDENRKNNESESTNYCRQG
jgi:hypothetical protein